MDIPHQIARASENQVRQALSNVMLGLADLGADGPTDGADAVTGIAELFSDTLSRCLVASEPEIKTTDSANGLYIGNKQEALSPPWGADHASAALQEGWIISECFGSKYGHWQIQRLDGASDVPGAPQLESDEHAWDIVLSGNGEHHAAALAFIRVHNPADYDALMGRAQTSGVDIASKAPK